MINIVLADDHSIVRSGLRKLLAQLENVKVLSECANGEEVMDFVNRNGDTDLVISNLNIPGMSSLELTTALQRYHPRIKVIILSMYEDLKHLIAAFQAGARAYLLKSAEMDELEFAVRIVCKNHKYIGTEFIDKLILLQANLQGQEQEYENLDRYSKRELEVLGLIADGFTNSEISNQLFLSKRTIEGHRQRLLQKTNANNTASLIRYAIKKRLVI